MTYEELKKVIDDAMWAGDSDKLDELAPCKCCCHEHTFDNCPARLWYGCRGNGSMTYADEESWRRHYQKHHNIDILAPDYDDD